MAESVDIDSSIAFAERICGPCNAEGNILAAKGFCLNCNEYLCGQCYNSHRRFKALENHVLQDKDSMPVAQDATNARSDKCRIHPSEAVEFFCRSCDVLGCSVCITINHRKCEKVVYIPDIAKEPETLQEFTEFDEKLKKADEELKQQEEEISSGIETNNEMKRLASEELRRQRLEINKFFDELEEKMESEMDNIENVNNETLKFASDRFESIEKDFGEITADIESKNGNKCELFISMKKNRKKIETLNDQFNTLLEEQRIQRYTVLPSEQIEAMMGATTEICRLATARLESNIDINTSTETLSLSEQTPGCELW